MKHALTSFFLAMMAILVPAAVQAHDFVVYSICYNITGSNEVAVTYLGDSPYSGNYSGNIDIPRTVTYNGKTYNVTSIGDMAFLFCENLKKVTIGPLVTSIGEMAFADCTSLSSVSFPGSLTSISRFAFMGCSSLTSVTLPNSLTTIPFYAFEGCGLKSLTIPPSVTTIDAYAFGSCSGLSSLTIPSTVTRLGANPFAYCSGLKSITVEGGNPNYDSREGCNAIIETATNTLVTACQATIIPSSVTAIGPYACAECNGMSGNIIPSTVTSIGAYAFDGCVMSSVTIPGSVKAIDGNPFTNCPNLQSITVESDNSSYDSREGCNAIIETAANKLVTGCVSTTIPRTVTALGDESFMGCNGLTAITIPNSVTDLGEYTFCDCGGLKNVVIPNSVKEIKGHVFDFCEQLTSVTMPNALTSIGESAFNYCGRLSSITIPATVTFIGEAAFWDCSSLKDVYSYIKSPASVTVEDDAFALLYPSYYWRTLHVPAGTVDAYKADKRWSDYFKRYEEMDVVVTGDVNGDGSVNISDVSMLIEAILSDGEFNSALDVNGDGSVNISDINAIIAIILQ